MWYKIIGTVGLWYVILPIQWCMFKSTASLENTLKRRFLERTFLLNGPYCIIKMVHKFTRSSTFCVFNCNPGIACKALLNYIIWDAENAAHSILHSRTRSVSHFYLKKKIWKNRSHVPLRFGLGCWRTTMANGGCS